MRALFSSVLAGLLLLSATGVQAQSLALAVGAGSDGVVSGVVGAELGRGVPTLTMTTDAQKPISGTFTVEFHFSEDVTGLITADISVLKGGTVSSVVEKTAQLYEVDIEPESDFDGVMTVTVRANGVRSVSTNQGNTVTDEDFDVDTKGPVLEEATVDEDELILTYDEDLDENSEPSRGDFTIEVDGTDFTVSTVDIRRDEVTLTLDDEVSGGDDVTIDYDPGTNPIQDERGNEASSLTDEEVENITADDLPSEPRRLTATAVDRTEIDLKWDAPSDNGGSRITGYRIQSADSDQGSWTTLESDTNDTDTEYTHTDLDPGTRQYYRVAAINRDGVGPWSDPANATTEGGVPSEPRNLTAVESGSARINLSWSAPISVTEAAASPATRSRCPRMADGPGPCG